MKIIIACEESGTVREAFKKRGHDATSCDILPSRIPGKHIQVKDEEGLKSVLYGQHWDMLIGHPPCTRLCNSGVLRL